MLRAGDRPVLPMNFLWGAEPLSGDLYHLSLVALIVMVTREKKREDNIVERRQFG